MVYNVYLLEKTDMHPTWTDLRAVKAVTSHRYPPVHASQLPGLAGQPDATRLRARLAVRSQLANLFLSIGKRLEHRHAQS